MLGLGIATGWGLRGSPVTVELRVPIPDLSELETGRRYPLFGPRIPAGPQPRIDPV